MNIYPPGSIIANRYEVAGRPLLGGMGIVYLCMDHQEDRPVALKTFRPEYLPDRSARDRFLREGTTWVDLGRHPHIVRCYNINRIGDGREVYLALEMVAQEQGRQDASLRSWLTSGQPLPVEQTLLFTLQIARGMKHATEKIPGFVHRDLNSENVLVGADRLSSLETNRLRVTDFGLANIFQEAGMSDQETPKDSGHSSADSNPSINRTQLTHGIVGTPLYMAPEQWQVRELGVWTDVYALGCILYEMLTGKRAVQGENLRALKQAHCGGLVQALPTSLPEDVRSLVKRCLQVEPGRRYTEWGELETALGKTWEQLNDQELPAPEASQQLERDKRVSVGWSYSEIGASYLDIGKADLARSYFERAQVVGQAEGERRLEGAGLNHLGNAHLQLGDAQRAIGFYEQYLKITREIEDRHGEGIALSNLGVTYTDLGDAQRAIGYLEQALTISHKLGERSMEGNILANLGSAHLILGDARQAIGFHEQALLILREIGDRRGIGATWGNLGSVYTNLGDAKQAIIYFEQSLIIAREIGDPYGESNALGSLGNTYYDLGNVQKAITFYEQYLNICREIGDIMTIATASINMAILYTQEGELQKAISLAQEAARIFSQIGHTQSAQRAQQLVAHLQGGEAPAGETPASNADNPAQQAFTAFQQTNSAEDMLSAITEYPFMTDAQFIAAVEQIITEQVPPEHKPNFQQRLEWLKQIAGK